MILGLIEGLILSLIMQCNAWSLLCLIIGYLLGIYPEIQHLKPWQLAVIPYKKQKFFPTRSRRLISDINPTSWGCSKVFSYSIVWLCALVSNWRIMLMNRVRSTSIIASTIWTYELSELIVIIFQSKILIRSKLSTN